MTVTLKPFQSANDVDLLARWLNEPHVLKWWGDPERNLIDAKERSADTHALIAADGKPVGYLRWQVASLRELTALGITDRGAALVARPIAHESGNSTGRNEHRSGESRCHPRLRKGRL